MPRARKTTSRFGEENPAHIPHAAGMTGGHDLRYRQIDQGETASPAADPEPVWIHGIQGDRRRRAVIVFCRETITAPVVTVDSMDGDGFVPYCHGQPLGIHRKLRVREVEERCRVRRRSASLQVWPGMCPIVSKPRSSPTQKVFPIRAADGRDPAGRCAAFYVFQHAELVRGRIKQAHGSGLVPAKTDEQFFHPQISRR